MEEKYCERPVNTDTIREVCKSTDIKVFGDFDAGVRYPSGDIRVMTEPMLPSESNRKEGEVFMDNLIAKELMKDKADPITKDHVVNSDIMNEDIFETPATNINFMQVVPNSQSFSELEQIAEYAKGKDQYLYIGIMNTIAQGYKLQAMMLKEDTLYKKAKQFVEEFRARETTLYKDDQDFDHPQANKHNS